MSVPTLFDKSETSFSTNGLGRLVGSVSCQVTEVGNGLYELEMRYLASDSMYQYLVQDNIIKAKLDDDRGYQCFDIYKVSLPINGIVTVNARHMCYRMNYIPIKPFSATGITATLQGLTNNALEVNPFVLSSDITNETSEYNQIEPKSLKACIGGTDGSILDIFSGSGAVELEYDNFNVHIWNHRGSDNGVQIRYGKNLTGFNYTRNTEESYTGAIGYWHDTDQTVNYYGDVQYNSNVGDYGYKKTVIVDFSEQQDTAPTKSQLNAWALAYITNIGIAKENITVNFVNLADTEEYKDIAPLETVGLFDTVHVFYEPYGLTVEKKVIKTVYDVLKERYTSIEIGDKKSSLSNTLIETSATVSKMVSVTQKIDREVGSITQTIGSVEERLDDLSVGATNLLVGTSAEWSDWYTPTADTQNYSIYAHWCYDLSSFKSGTDLTVSYDLEFDGANAGSGGESHIYLQSCAYPNMDNSTGAVWNKIPFPTTTKLLLPLEDGIHHYSYTVTIPDNIDYTDYARFMVNFRTDYWNGTGKVRVRFLMLEVGNIPTDWSPAPDDLENSITTTTRTLENKITSTAESTTQSMKDYVQEQVDGVTSAYEKYTSDKISTAKGDLQTWTSETYDGRLDNIESDADELEKTVDGLDDTVNNASTGLKKRVITSETNIEDLTHRLELIENGVGKAFVYTKDGAKVMAIKNNVVQDDTYTLTDEHGNHYIINGNETGWATSEEFGAQQLSLGEDSTSEQRWQFKRDSANRLNINWHS